MKVAVTGGCGFIGSHVVDKLTRRRASTCACSTASGTPHRDDVEHVPVDIMDQRR